MNAIDQRPWVFTVEQVAKICNVSQHTVRKWLDSGRLKGYRIPGSHSWRVPRTYLMDFMRQHGMDALLPTEVSA